MEIPEKVHWMIVHEGGGVYSVSAPGWKITGGNFDSKEETVIENMVRGSISECCDYIRSIVEFDIMIDKERAKND